MSRMFEQHDAFLSYISTCKETVHELAEGQKKDKQQMWLDLGNHARDLWSWPVITEADSRVVCIKDWELLNEQR